MKACGAYLSNIFTQHIEKENVKIILELGSGNGLDAIRLEKYYNAKVFTFEPNPEGIKTCEENLKEHPRIALIKKAVSDKDAKIPFFTVTDGRFLASAIYKMGSEYPEQYKQEAIEVEATRLDTWIEENNIPPIDMICMDVQGAELKALVGMGKYLQNVKYIITELTTKEIYQGQDMLPEVKDYLEKQGFTLIVSLPANSWFGDYLFTKVKKIEKDSKYYDNVFNTWYAGDDGAFDKVHNIMIDIFEKHNNKSAIDVGCGTGCLTNTAQKRGHSVDGIDFSLVGINKAKQKCPKSVFFHKNVFDAQDIFGQYNCFFMSEFLEHIKDDIEFINSLPKGSLIIASVPNFDWISHLRYFKSSDDVLKRYGKLFNIKEVIANGNHFIFYGEK